MNTQENDKNTTEIAGTTPTKPGIALFLLTIIVVLINIGLTSDAAEKTSDLQGLIGYEKSTAIGAHVFSTVVFFPLIIIILFQIGKKFRNARSRLTIFLITNIVFTLPSIANYAKHSGNIVSNLNEGVRQIAEVMNKELPKNMSKGARMDSVIANNKKLTISITLTDLEAKNVNRTLLAEQMSANFCSEKQKFLINRGSIIELNYSDKNSDPIVNFSITKEYCEMLNESSLVKQFIKKHVLAIRALATEYKKEPSVIIYFQGLLDASRIRPKSNLSQNKKTISEVITIIDQYNEKLSVLNHKIKNDINLMSISDSSKSILQKDLAKIINISDTGFQLEKKKAIEMGKITTFLLNRYGEWTIENGQISFFNDSDVEKFNQYVSSIKGLTAEQQNLTSNMN